MNDDDVIDNELVDKFDAEDTIFNNCINDFDEFPAYITGHDDIVGNFPVKHMNPAFRNLNMDSIRQRKNGNLVNIEHHSVLNSDLMRRDYNYITTIFQASKQIVEPFIFNTGPIPLKKVEYVNDTMFYNPAFVNTCEMRGTVMLNNLRYKVKHKEELTQSDGLDLIWLVKTNIDIDREELLRELTVDIWAKAVAPRWMLDAIRKNLILWAKKYLKSKDIIEEFKRVIKMSKIEIKPFEEQIRIAGIAGELERAEETGLEKGLEKGLEDGHANGCAETEEKFILKLLETQSPEEISQNFEVPLERVLEIANGNC